MKCRFDKAVIWDMDGVIADTAEFHFTAWKSLVEGAGKSYSQKDFQQGFGLRNDDILYQIFGQISRDRMDSLSAQKEELFRSSIEGKITLLPGVQPLLDILKEEKFKIGLASSAPATNIHLILELLGISTYFDCVVCADDVVKGKPDPEVFLVAAKRLGVKPSRSIVIEDAVSGVEAAGTAGMKCIAVTNTHPAEAFGLAEVVTNSLGNITVESLNRLIIEG